MCGEYASLQKCLEIIIDFMLEFIHGQIQLSVLFIFKSFLVLCTALSVTMTTDPVNATFLCTMSIMQSPQYLWSCNNDFQMETGCIKLNKHTYKYIFSESLDPRESNKDKII